MKNTKKNSVMKKILPSACMLAVSAAMLSTSTYAWFSMSKDVSVNGMKINATAEGGLLVADADGSSWGTVATAKYHSAVSLLPTSTANTTNWFYNTSDLVSDAKAGQADATYTTLSGLTDPKSNVSDGAFGVDGYDYYLLNDFYIKSSGNEIDTTSNALQILQVKATSSGTGSVALDKSVRVAIVVDDTLVGIYAPVSGATTSYKVGGATGGTSVSAVDVSSNNGVLATPAAVTLADAKSNKIPANTATTSEAVHAKIYMYFEGEDTNCKSENITNMLDDIEVAVKFGLAKGSAAMATQTAVVTDAVTTAAG